METGRSIQHTDRPQTSPQADSGGIADRSESYAATAVQHEAGGYAGYPPGGRQCSMGIGDDGEGEGLAVQMSHDLRGPSRLDGYRDDVEILRDGGDGVVTESAHGAPGGPKMDQDRLALQAVEIEPTPTREIAGQGRGIAVGEGLRSPPVQNHEDHQDQDQLAEPAVAAGLVVCCFLHSLYS